jgi:hypothetical protein
MQGYTNENHLRAALWNIAMAIYMENNIPAMQDIPARKQGETNDCND